MSNVEGGLVKIFNFHVITGKTLKQMLSDAKAEQRKFDSAMMAKLTEDNVRLSEAYRIMRGSKRR